MSSFVSSSSIIATVLFISGSRNLLTTVIPQMTATKVQASESLNHHPSSPHQAFVLGLIFFPFFILPPMSFAYTAVEYTKLSTLSLQAG